MVYIGAIVGAITVSLSIGVMAFLQGQFKGEDCKKSRDRMLIIMMLAIAGSIGIFIVEWLPLVPSLPRALMACVGSIATIAMIIIGISWVAWTEKDCGKAQSYNWLFAVILALLEVITIIFTIF